MNTGWILIIIPAVCIQLPSALLFVPYEIQIYKEQKEVEWFREKISDIASERSEFGRDEGHEGQNEGHGNRNDGGYEGHS